MTDPLNLHTVDIDDPNKVVNYIWAGTNNVAGYPTLYEGVEGTCASVSTGRDTGNLRLEIGYDPHEDGLLWCIAGDTFGDGSQYDVLHSGGWAPGDRATAEAEISHALSVMNGNA